MRTPTLGAVRTVLILWTATAALPQGIITTIAGTDFVFRLQPVPALQAPLGSTAGVAFDSRGNLYIADRDNHLVLKVDSGGTLTIVAGNGSPGFSGDGGPAVSAALNRPLAVAVDTAGNLYIADSSNNRVRQVGLEGIIRTVAGSGSNSGTSASAGDGAAAVLASLPSPSGLAIGSGGTLYVAVSDRIRKVDSSGVISTVAGNGAAASTGDLDEILCYCETRSVRGIPASKGQSGCCRLPKSPEASAVRYALNQWEALNRFLQDGDLEIDNGATERATGA